MSLSFMEKCCPSFIIDCIRAIFVTLSKSLGKKQKNESSALQQLQEQQFQFSTGSKLSKQQQKSLQKSSQPQSTKLQIQNDDNLTIKLNLKSNNEEQQEMKLNQSQEYLSLKLTTFNFKLNLEPYHEYYNVIEQKTKHIQDIFGNKTKNVIKKTRLSEINVEEIQTLSGYKMIVSYKLPCSYSFFKKINGDEQITTTLNAIINEQKTIEAIHSNLTINHLSFKKFMLLEPRYFHYLKYQNSTLNYHWQICTSIKGKAEIQPKQKECELTTISCFEQRKQGLIANTYLQVDLKSNIKANKVVLRVYQELSSYIDELYTYAKQNYREEQV